MTRIAVLGLHSECASTSPLSQTRADFARVEGAALTALVPTQTPGDLVPLLLERSVPGGPLPRAVFDAQLAEMLGRLAAAGPVDGVLLLMHGALFVPGLDDPEGELIAQVRAAVGPDVVLSAAFDLHGNITQRVVDGLDCFAAYRTAPHVDVAETRARALAMLHRALDGPRPVVVRVPVPVVVSGEMSATTVAPCRDLYAALPGYEGDGVWDANLMIGYVWADTGRATAAAVVTCTDVAAGQAAACGIARSLWDARRDLVQGMDSLPLDQALARALAALPATLADSGDNPTAGGVGDRADALAAVMGQNALVAGICAPDACAALALGRRRIGIGGALGGGGPKVTLDIDSARAAGDDWIINSGDTTVVITARRRPFHTPDQFCGLDPTAAPLLVVKSGYLSPYLAGLDRTAIMALTDGAVTQDFAALPNLYRPRPTWPFQRDFDWSPSCT